MITAPPFDCLHGVISNRAFADGGVIGDCRVPFTVLLSGLHKGQDC
jgi:hypothetical protein